MEVGMIDTSFEYIDANIIRASINLLLHELWWSR